MHITAEQPQYTAHNVCFLDAHVWENYEFGFRMSLLLWRLQSLFMISMISVVVSSKQAALRPSPQAVRLHEQDLIKFQGFHNRPGMLSKRWRWSEYILEARQTMNHKYEASLHANSAPAESPVLSTTFCHHLLAKFGSPASKHVTEHNHFRETLSASVCFILSIAKSIYQSLILQVVSLKKIGSLQLWNRMSKCFITGVPKAFVLRAS